MIRNLVSCIGKSSYYSTSRILAGEEHRTGFSRGACHLPAPANENGESNAKFYFAFPGGDPSDRPRRYFYSNFARSVLLSRGSSARPALERKEAGGRIMRAEVVRPLARSLAGSLVLVLVRPNAVNSICSRPYLTRALGRACKSPGAIDIPLTAAK